MKKKNKSGRSRTDKGNLAVEISKQSEFEEKVKSQDSEIAESGVVYVGHIPHGFYEKEMKDFFSQFGTVKRLRLSRSRETGSSKGYAFVEFEYEDVAKIAAETMDNYLLFGRLLKCKMVPKDRLHPRIWVGANRKFKKINWVEKERIKHNKAKPKSPLWKWRQIWTVKVDISTLKASMAANKPKSSAARKKLVKKLVNKENKTRLKLEALGIDYKFPGYVAQSTNTSKQKETKEDSEMAK